MTIIYRANEIQGLSTDTKPTLVPTNTAFFETDTLRTYNFNGTVWVLSGIGGSVSNAELDGNISFTKIANGTVGKVIGFNASTGAVEEQTPSVGITSFTNSAVVSQSTTIGDYTTPTTMVESSPIPSVEYLVVGGGGGGLGYATYVGGGGGAGGFSTGSNLVVSAQTYTVTVGAGGNGSADYNGDPNPALTKGSSSTFSSITSLGGGGGDRFGGGPDQTHKNGGSGGGGSCNPGAGTGTVGQGNNGGNFTIHSCNVSGGGGGAGAVGGSYTPSYAGVGGAGVANPIVGSTSGVLSGGIYYLAGGGAGGGNVSSAVGGIGGGGNSGVAGIANTGGGGGAGFSGNATGKAGGSGIVIIKYLTSVMSATGGNITTVGGHTIHTFLSSGSFVVTPVNGASSVKDNNTATRWTSSSESNPNIYVDMGSALNLCAAAFYFDSTNTTNTEILIQSSADASTWTTKRTITKSDLTNGAYNFYRFNIAGGARYIRFYGNSAGSTVLSIWEIKILKKTDAEIFNDLGMLTITPNDTTLSADGT